MVVFPLDEITVYFPYDFIYPEQYAYIRALKQTLDAKGHAVLEMPTGTGKTVALFSLLTSYQLAHPGMGKILYCTRTVPEMEKALLELKGVIDYRIQEIAKAQKKQQEAVAAAASQAPAAAASTNAPAEAPAAAISGDCVVDSGSASSDKTGEKADSRNAATAASARPPSPPASTAGSHVGVQRPSNAKSIEPEPPPFIGKEMISAGYILALGLSARRNMCINPAVCQQPDREKIDQECRERTAPWVRQQYLTSDGTVGAGDEADAHTPDIEDVGTRGWGAGCATFSDSSSSSRRSSTAAEGRRSRVVLPSNEEAEPGRYSPALCAWYENFDRFFTPQFFPAGVYTIEELKTVAAQWRHPILNRTLPFCPYFLARRLLHTANVVVLNYQYILDPKVSQAALLTPPPDASQPMGRQPRSTYINPYRGAAGSDDTNKEVGYEGSVVVFDEAHNIDNVCIEALSVNMNHALMDGALRNLSQLAERIDAVKREDAERLRAEYEELIRSLKRRRTENESAEEPAEEAATQNDSVERQQQQQRRGHDKPGSTAESEQGPGAAGQRAEASARDAEKNKRQKPAAPGEEVSRGRQPSFTGETLDLLASPLLPNDALVEQAIPGSIRKAEHFVAMLRRVVAYLKSYIKVYELKSEGPLSFLHMFERETHIDASLLRFFYDRLKSLFNTLQLTEVESYAPLTLVADFCTLVATYCEGFILICDPYPEAVGLYDPLLQLSCLDASLAMQPVLKRYQSLILTSGTISPLELYPKLLNFVPVITASFPMSLDRNCICPLIVARGSDQVPLTSKFEYRHDMNVLRNYSNLLIDLCRHVPDGLVCFFTSYAYMESVLSTWYQSGVLAQVLEYKLIFIETKDVVATTLALHSFRKACDCGRGAVFFSIARGKVAEGIDFDRHFGRCVVLFGVPFQYTLSRVLKARLDFIREHYQICDNEFLTFDAMRQAAQCVGRIIRSKSDYGLMVFADARYSRADKRSKLPPWILKHLDNAHLTLNTETAISVARTFLRHMSQPPPPPVASRLGGRQLQEQDQCWEFVRRSLHLGSSSCVIGADTKGSDTPAFLRKEDALSE